MSGRFSESCSVLGIVLLATAVFATRTLGTDIGRDAADDPAYAKRPSWSSGANGGKGFKGWNLVAHGEPSGDRGFKIGDSRSINSDINSPGDVAFGMFAAGRGNSAEAYRSLQSPLAVGDSFQVDIAVNFRSGAKGLDLRSPATDGERVLFNFNIGVDDYVIHKATTGGGSLGMPYDAKTSFAIRFTQTEENAGTWTITRRGGAEAEVKGHYEGRAAGVKFYVRDTDGGKENELWLNNLVISAADRQ